MEKTRQSSYQKLKYADRARIQAQQYLAEYEKSIKEALGPDGISDEELGWCKHGCADDEDCEECLGGPDGD